MDNKDKIKCQVCGKDIGTYDKNTDEVIEMYDDYNTCDECGKEICSNCTVNINYEINDIDEYGRDVIIYSNFNGCKECSKNI